MKKITTLICLSLGLSNFSFAQAEEESNCYLDYVRVFEERGAFEVEDGSHDNVIITFRYGSTAECYNGKADVVDGQVVAMYLRLEDGSFEELKRKYKYEIKEITVKGGISRTIITPIDELINVLFVKTIKPKKKGYEKAPSASDL